MITTFKQTIDTHQLITAGDHILLALSGGADSVALLHALKSLQATLDFQLCALHINHHLRGEASQADEAFVVALCKTLNIPLSIHHAQVADLAKTAKVSTETMAREVRYKALNQHLRQIGANKIATAHHQDDHVETLLLHFFRGAGLKGLTGIPPRSGHLIRPLRDCLKEDILNYCHTHGFAYQTDHTNFENNHTRNKLRNLILPALKDTFHPNIGGVLTANSTIWKQEDDYLDQLATTAYHQAVLSPSVADDTLVLNRQQLQGLHPAIGHRLMQKALGHFHPSLQGFSHIHIQSLWSLTLKETGKKLLNLPHGLTAHVSYEHLHIGPFKAPKTYAYPLKMGDFLHIPEANFYVSLNPQKILKKNYHNTCTKSINCGKMKGSLLLRTRQAGDYFPLTHGGTQKLKHYFINQKVPQHQRDLPLLASGSHILWLFGHPLPTPPYSASEQGILQLWQPILPISSKEFTHD